MMRLLLVVVSIVMFSTQAMADQPFPSITLTKDQIKRLQRTPETLKSASERSKRIVDKALGKDLDSRATKLFAVSQIKAIRAKATDKNFVGVIATIDNGDIKLSVERRIVLTWRGPFNLLLSRYGDTYVYDGDMIVAHSAIMPLGGQGNQTIEDLQEQFPGIAFSAGYPGRFGNGTLWDDAILPYEVDANFCCTEALDQAILDYNRTTVVRLVPRDGHENYLRFMNAEPFTTSRVELGKQPGRNEVRIQGFRSDGTAYSAEEIVPNITHEIGHELGLIHEHLRSDRDRFIGRNPNCNPDGVYEYLRSVWIDTGNVTFTDDGAELLTRYDFDSIMHYNFQVPRPGGGNCDTWVRLSTCTNRDPASENCRGEFFGDVLTQRDIEGIHKLYIEVPGAAARLPEPAQVQQFSDGNVRHRGKRIDKCLHGLPIGQDGCRAAARDRVANEFCRAKGFQDGFASQYESMMGVHSGLHVTYGWQNVWGGDVLSSVGCQNFTSREERVQNGTADDDSFGGDEVRLDGRYVDRCVHGNGIQGDRCSAANQRRVADAFCARWGYAESAEFATDLAGFALEINATGFDVGQARFRDVTAVDIFTSIRCIRDAGETNRRRFAAGEIRLLDKAVDRCVHGTPFGEDRCSSANQQRAANNFCQEKDFDSAASFLTSVSPNAIAAGYHPATDDFRDIYGSIDIISSVECMKD